MTGKYKAYPEYKDSGVEWLGEIPKHWDKKRIKETASLINGYPFDSKLFEAGKGTPLVRIRDIRSSGTEVGFVGDVPKSALINNGDLLIGMDGDFNVSIWNGGLAALNQRVACVRAPYYHLQKFIFYALPFNMKVVNDLTYFTTVKHLSSIEILKSVYPFPSENELTKIVEFLDHETAKIDTLIEKQQQLIQLLKEKRQAVISHAVTKGLNPNAPMRDSGVEWLGEMPEHWEVASVSHLFSLQAGGDLKLNFFSHEKSLKHPYPIFTNTTKSQKPYGYTSKPFFDGNTITVTGRGEVGYAVFREEPYDAIIRLLVLKPMYDNIICQYFVYFINSKLSFNEGSSAINQLSTIQIAPYKLAIPSLEEQQEIVQYLNEKTQRIDTLIMKAEEAIALMQERRTALISAAVTGKIDVRHHACHPTGDLQSSKSTVHGDL